MCVCWGFMGIIMYQQHAVYLACLAIIKEVYYCMALCYCIVAFVAFVVVFVVIVICQ